MELSKSKEGDDGDDDDDTIDFSMEARQRRCKNGNPSDIQDSSELR